MKVNFLREDVDKVAAHKKLILLGIIACEKNFQYVWTWKQNFSKTLLKGVGSCWLLNSFISQTQKDKAIDQMWNPTCFFHFPSWFSRWFFIDTLGAAYISYIKPIFIIQ